MDFMCDLEPFSEIRSHCVFPNKRIVSYLQSSGVRVNNIDILEGNLIGANGIVHIIDTAVMPPSADLILGSRSVSNHCCIGQLIKLGSLG